jgi:site-specific DNA-cytosine methylase
MKYFDAFSGIGGFPLGIQLAYESLYNLRPNELSDSERPEELHDTSDKLQQWECVGYSEINKYATTIYQKHFPYEQCERCRTKNEGQEVQRIGDTEGFNSERDNISPVGLTCTCKHKQYGDITKIIAEDLPDFDLFVGGFPCQAFSIAGKRGGFDDTRGTLFFDCARILKEKRPRNFILENVKGLLSHDGGRTFKTIITTLAELGYCVEWQVLNAKDFGVPQNRERVFIVGHFGGMPRRKVFPIRKTNSKALKQIIGGSQGYRVYDKDGLACTQATQAGGVGAKTGLYISRVDRGKGTIIRRLTPVECERLMGFPDNWTEGVSDTQRYKCLGNGVVSNVVTEIVKGIYFTK